MIRQQYLPFMVCAEGCETTEERSDDEVCTSQVPERSEGKTKVMRQWYLPFTVLKPTCTFAVLFATFGEVAIVLTVGGILIEPLALA